MQRACEQCGNMFKFEPRRVATAHYCSRSCLGISQRKQQIYQCKGCGAQISAVRSRAASALYCSNPCATKSRFGAEYQVNELTGCWEWNRALTDEGYGKGFRKDISTRFAHRALWIEKNGPVPEGMELDHLCKNKRCVNPTHLEPVTHKINMDRSDRIVLARGATGCRYGHLWTSENTYIQPSTGTRLCRECLRISHRKTKLRKRMKNQP